MENKVFLERDQKVTAILRAVDKNQKFKAFKQVYSETPFTEYEFAGQIGPDVTFTKACRKYDSQKYSGVIAGVLDVDVTRVNLACNGKDLGQITVQHKTTRENLKTVSDVTGISVVSPFWEEGKGKKIIENHTEQVAHKQKHIALGICRGDHETFSEVIDRISDTIAKSQDKAVIAKKLRKLNLPSKVTVKNQDALVENIVNQIHSADREM